MSIGDLWKPKFGVGPTDTVSTFGSCFAQHIGRALARRGYHWLDAEPAPPNVSDRIRKRFNYGIFSARTGNIYTARSLLQWVRWSLSLESVPDEIWESDGRFYDPFRPAIELQGFASAEELYRSRAAVLDAFRKSLEETDVFVFTMGLTEGWIHKKRGYVYPMCPGTLAGSFDADLHEFRNFSYPEIEADMREALALMRGHNPRLRVLLTVSPVPLTATASGHHVLVATTYSKSVLRAVAGSLAGSSPFIDYFPSYEIITGIPYRSMFYDPNLRTVASSGVEHVMKLFFEGNSSLTKPCLPPRQSPKGGTTKPSAASEAHASAAACVDDEVACEEQLLGAFAGGGAS